VPERIIKTAVVVLTYQAARFVDDCFGSLRRAHTEGLDVNVIAVDNASTDDTVQRIRTKYPEVTVIENRRNLGFAEGNNVGIRLALARGAEFVYLLNADTEVTPAFLRESVAVARRTPEAGAVQSLLVLWSERDRVNTAGNVIHYLGFGYCARFREPVSSIGPEPREVAYCSGASVLYRAEALERAGLLDEELFLYHEDLDLGWRLRLAGYRNVLAPTSVVLHKYEFSRNPEKFYYMERNRLLVMLMNVRLRNLAVLAPLLVASEFGLCALAATSGWLPQKVRGTLHLLRPAAWRHIARGRRRQSRIRKVTDREIFELFVTEIKLEGATPLLVPAVANRVLAWTWRLFRPLVR
jgi:GT2 family glycosyltransferase